MKLYLVHAGFYDENISGGFYESHTNYFIVASDVKEAKLKAKKIPEYKKKKMHIDGIKVIEKVENYIIKLIEDGAPNDNSDAHYSYDDVKKMQ
tara:strand:- start:255 stop:533 length:279 start_codon:yes stop_codon:yes gene_type:complete